MIANRLKQLKDDHSDHSRFLPRLSATGHWQNRLDDISDRLVMLLQVHADKETMKREETKQK